MKRYALFTLAVVIVVGISAFSGVVIGRATAADDSEKAAPASTRTILAHDLYFALKDNSPEAEEKLIEACKEYLAPHPGVVHFAVGTRSDIKGAFNDQNYDVALHMEFVDRAALGTYAKTDLHQQFVKEMTANLKGLRIFDSTVEQVGK